MESRAIGLEIKLIPELPLADWQTIKLIHNCLRARRKMIKNRRTRRRRGGGVVGGGR